MLTRRFVLTLLLGATLVTPVFADAANNGLDVTLITYDGLPGNTAGTMKFRGNGRWIEKNGEGTFNYVEKSRTASKIVLYDKKRKATIIIMTKVGGTLSWVWNNSPVTPYATITALSK
ncbi:MAG: hypothetical protein ABL879_09680 [Devosia sp.]